MAQVPEPGFDCSDIDRAETDTIMFVVAGGQCSEKLEFVDARSTMMCCLFVGRGAESSLPGQAFLSFGEAPSSGYSTDVDSLPSGAR